ncbi:hypothetical protein SAMD00019534_091520 [Acytostelium subglobosum LB1]|uniref:hypothetical protein n=1 Tax=Acytostelium subglobosum LB1 TaxID=1410327 RepID=UPI000644BBDD|nr:hypothetical protein SAMD00019534_091520 [Acytostelium subglobosum LB1]GAM25977.1 hypothetical protein SAMD00019534_091520 [Acytostelium subglobosum LB1]|eukprot:XP_012751020.1 hypothetical protein SAMD00019534_091520 [Acytostelium subglobosum LB1]
MEKKQFSSVLAYWSVKDKTPATGAPPPAQPTSVQSKKPQARPTSKPQPSPEVPASSPVVPVAQVQEVAPQVQVSSTTTTTTTKTTAPHAPAPAQAQAQPQPVSVTGYSNVQFQDEPHIVPDHSRPVGDDSSNDGSNNTAAATSGYLNAGEVTRSLATPSYYDSSLSLDQPTSAYSIMPMSSGAPTPTTTSSSSKVYDSTDTAYSIINEGELTNSSLNQSSTYSAYSRNAFTDSYSVAYAQASRDHDSTFDDDDEDEDEDQLIRERSLLKSREVKDHGRNWNREFQDILNLPPSNEKFQQMTFMAIDFVKAAETYGKIIIKEMFMNDALKTIKPINIGGVAGGAKYICQNILFKFAYDQKILDTYLYGGKVPSDYGASKAAGNELRGLSYFFQNILDNSLGHRMHVPLMCIIDYLGYRLIAISLLPIKKETLVYGSSDGGNTVHDDVEEVNEMMEQVGKKMNLRGHLAGLNPKYIYGPGDFEIHQSEDNDFYALDFGRLLPPQAYFDHNGHAIAHRDVFFKLLRPEFVRNYEKPLSSDAFTGWGTEDPKQDVYNQDISDATSHLFDIVIRQAATELESLAKSDYYKVEMELVRFVHTHGINLRHLGRLRSMIDSSNTQLREHILNEMVVRVLKGKIKDELRVGLSSEGYFIGSEEKCIEIIITFMNKVFNVTRFTTQLEFWTVQIKGLLVDKYGSECGLTLEELDANYDLFKSISLSRVITRLQEKTGITFSERIKRYLEKNPVNIYNKAMFPKMLYTDVLGVNPVVKHSNMVARSEGISMYMKALEAIYTNSVSIDRPPRAPEYLYFTTQHDEELSLLEMCKEKLETASRTSTTDASLYHLLGMVDLEIIKLTSTVNRPSAMMAIKNLLQSLSYLESAGVLVTLATVHDLRGDYKAAQTYLDRINKLDPATAVPDLFESATTHAPYYCLSGIKLVVEYTVTSLHQLLHLVALLEALPQDHPVANEYLLKAYKVLAVVVMRVISQTDYSYIDRTTAMVKSLTGIKEMNYNEECMAYFGPIIERGMQRYPSFMDDIIQSTIDHVQHSVPLASYLRYGPNMPAVSARFVEQLRRHPSCLRLQSDDHKDLIFRNKDTMKMLLSVGVEYDYLQIRHLDHIEACLDLLPLQQHLTELTIDLLYIKDESLHMLEAVFRCLTPTLEKLQMTRLNDTTKRAKLPAGLSVPNLRTVILKEPQWSDELMIEFAKLIAPSVEDLTLETVPNPVLYTTWLNQFTRLKKLDVSYFNEVFKVEYLPTSLTHINWGLTADIPEREYFVDQLFARCPSLVSLIGGSMDSQYAKELKQLKKHPIRELYINTNRANLTTHEMHLDTEVWAGSLETLRLVINTYGQFDHYPQMLSAFTNLRDLNMEIGYVDDFILEVVTKNLLQLESLDVSSCRNVKLLPQTPHTRLRRLVLSQMSSPPANYENLGLMFPNLLELIIMNSYDFNDMCLRKLLVNVHGLSMFQLLGGSNITDSGVISLCTSSNTQTLVEIALNSQHIGDSSFIKVAESCPKLRTFKRTVPLTSYKSAHYYAARYPQVYNHISSTMY